ncbi:MAG: aromatic aminobenezylarsenical efflux permease ArsG family transporter [Candidatus Zixiibacteriota bacterium]
MDTLLLAVGSAFTLGFLTSISPCPLATNVAAISYIGRQVTSPARVIATGLMYTLGRSAVYVAVGALTVAGTMAVPKLSFFLQNHFNEFLGPILLVAGLILLGALRFKGTGPAVAEGTQERLARQGLWGGGLLGVLFALSFCPVSAALYFGSLIPLAVKSQSTILVPTVFGIGTAIPVVAFAVLIAVGTRFIGGVFNRLTALERWARLTTGVVFVLIGLYLSAVHILGVQLF